MKRSELVSVDGTDMSVVNLGLESSPTHLIWAHGWGQSGSVFMPLAESMGSLASSSVLDFPGFGKSPLPPLTWGTAEYADYAARWLASTPEGCRIWVGHSFGCRIGLQIASRHPGLFSGMVLIAAAGLQRNRPWPEKLRYMLRRNLFKLARKFVPEGPRLEALRSRLGSSDYKTAGPLRPIFSRVVAEDLSSVAQTVGCPVLLLYGALDTDTPPEIGERLQKLIPKANLILLDGFDHHSILADGRHQVMSYLRKFVETTCQRPT